MLYIIIQGTGCTLTYIAECLLWRPGQNVCHALSISAESQQVPGADFGRVAAALAVALRGRCRPTRVCSNDRVLHA